MGINFEIISSGSKGNCIKIENVMIDCGVGFKQIKDHLYDIKYLLITHKHQDHLKMPTLLSIMENFPHIKIIGNYEVYEQAPVMIIANAGFELVFDDYTFNCFECVHDVLTYGYYWRCKGQDIIYCTDTGSMENAPDQQFDYFFLESNHDEQKLAAAAGDKKGRYDPFLSGKRHLSTQECKAYFYMHRKGIESRLIELHKSSRFY
jgi:hypothetical protein